MTLLLALYSFAQFSKALIKYNKYIDNYDEVVKVIILLLSYVYCY